MDMNKAIERMAEVQDMMLHEYLKDYNRAKDKCLREYYNRMANERLENIKTLQVLKRLVEIE